MSSPEFDKVNNELKEIRDELKAIRAALKGFHPKIGSTVGFDGDITTPDPTQTTYYTPNQDLTIVLQFQIPGDAALFVSGFLSFQDDDNSPAVIWPQDGAAVPDLLANTVTFNVLPPVNQKTGSAKQSKAAKKLKSTAKDLLSGTGTGTVIHTKRLFIFTAQFQSNETLRLAQH